MTGGGLCRLWGRGALLWRCWGVDGRRRRVFWLLLAGAPETLKLDTVFDIFLVWKAFCVVCEPCLAGGGVAGRLIEQKLEG